MAHHVSRRLALIMVTLTLAMGIPLGIALAAHFGDVPNSHPFHNDIAAIADAGVTSGCGGGDFCPDRNVTRAEMAAFLNRLGALGPGKPPVANANEVDGLDANDLTRVAGDAGTIGTTAITATFGSFQDAAEIVINAPGSGFVLVNAAIGAQNTAATCAGFVCGIFVRLNNTTTTTVSPYVVVDVHGGTHPNATASVSYVFPVSAGNNTIKLQIARASAGQSPTYFSPQLTGIFSPFGSSGGSTLGSSEAAAPGGSPAGQ